MKHEILRYNKIYSSALSLADKVLKLLYNRDIDSGLGFYDQVYSRIDGELICRNYPMPIITCFIKGYKTQIGFDIVTNKNYLGFIKFTLTRDEILNFDFNYIFDLEYSIYSTYNHQNYKLKEIKETKINIRNSNSCEFRIKIDFSSLNQVEAIINRMTKINNKFFNSALYTCTCGNHIAIDANKGECPVCGKDSPYKMKFMVKCPVCKNNCLKDQIGNGKCYKCGWKLNDIGERRKNIVICPNLVSLNKARKLYKEGKPLTPDFDDFISGYIFYGEMEFNYKGTIYGVVGIANEGIEFFNTKSGEYIVFKDVEEFAAKAQINGKFLKDLWNEVTNVNWIQ